MSATTAYVWQGVAGITTDYHNGGGVLIVTAGDPRKAWREHAEETNARKGQWGEDLDPAALDEEPSHTFPASHNGDLMVIFPDAGCC